MLSKTSKEEWYINSTVDAYVAMQAAASDFRSNNTTWLNDIESSVDLWPSSGLSGAFLWERPGVSVGFMPSRNNTRCFIGVYQHSIVQEGFITFSDLRNPAYESEYAAFRPYAQKFIISRRRCSGRWKLNSTSIILLGGDCDLDTPTNSSVLHAPFMIPYPYDVLPELHYVFTGFAPSGNGPKVDGVWLNATYAVTVATVWWARALYMAQNLEGTVNLADYGGLYSAVRETIISVRPTLEARPLLYMVLAIHPAITLVAFLTAAALYHVPLGRGFGVVSILSGLDHSSSQIIRGAGFSGQLTRQVGLQITAEARQPNDEAKVSYRLADPSPRMTTRTYLQSNRRYG